MKPQDLMIGDWVKCTNPYCEGHRVDYISELEDEIGVDGEIWDLTDVIPIPLTQEILEKNEFENITSRLESSEQYIHLYEINDDIVIGELPSGFNICIERYNGDYDVYEHFQFCSICFVHELQHALRLCGIEKNIII